MHFIQLILVFLFDIYDSENCRAYYYIEKKLEHEIKSYKEYNEVAKGGHSLACSTAVHSVNKEYK